MSHKADDAARDRALGMDRPISRRDFLNGVALSVAALGLSNVPGLAASPASDPAKRLGLAGHSEAAMKIMHAIRDGQFWDKAPPIEPGGETYDLIVVGGGISGLAAAFLYRQQMPDAKILILENNDEFGGHARRNEFVASSGKRIIGYGGSQSLQSPSYFSPLVNAVLADIGIDLEAFKTYYNQDWWDQQGLADAMFFRKENFGADALVVTTESAADWVPATPLNDRAKAELIELIDAPRDYLIGNTREEKFKILSETTYADFLTKIFKGDPELVSYFQNSTEEYFGLGIDGTTALDAWGNGNPGFGGMDLGEMPYKTMSPSGRLVLTDPDDYIYHFPDGNAGVARALLRALIPDALPGASMEELVNGQVDYSKLDLKDNSVRLRLSASAVRVKHEGDPASAKTVTITYMEEGKLKTVAGANAVLACWHRIIPHITDELGQTQIDALNDQVKVPLIYANVLVKNFEAFAKLGVAGFYAPNSFWRGVFIDDPVSVGEYKCAADPSEPVLLHLFHFPLPGTPGMSARDQATAGRYALTELTFETMEREARDLLQRALGPGGFDAARDIEAITANRWSHGYALEYMRPWDQFWPDGPLPIETARKGWGRITIANSDSGAYAYAHSAIDQAGRAISELLGEKSTLPAYAEFPGPPREALGL